MIPLEEKLLVNILYREEKEVLKGIDLNNINFEKLIKLASGHLMLPALFYNIKKKKVSYLFPEDFIEYIKNIFEINKARNEVLLSEAKELSALLVENNIKHIFLKGTALLLSEVLDKLLIQLFKVSVHIENIYLKNLILIQLFFSSELMGRALTKIRIHYQHKTLLNYIYIWLKP